MIHLFKSNFDYSQGHYETENKQKQKTETCNQVYLVA